MCRGITLSTKDDASSPQSVYRNKNATLASNAVFICNCRWSFETTHYDLAFGIYLKVTESPRKLSEMKQVVDTTRVNCHLVPEDGYYTCKEPGTCE